MANNNRMSFEDIRDLLFSDERNMIPNTQLLEMLKVLIGDTEGMMMNRVRDLEWPFRCMLRVRQLLKSNIPRNFTNPYHVFCLSVSKTPGRLIGTLIGF